MASDSAGNLYIADTLNERVRKVTPQGIISTVAGAGGAGYSGDGGSATGAMLNSPESVALDGAGNLYFADRYNQRVRKVTPQGIISTVAGTGTAGYSGDGGPAQNAKINYPHGVATDAAGNVYVADGNNNRVREVEFPGLATSTVTGSAFKSDDCDPAGTNLVTGFVDGAFIKAKTAPGGVNATWVCVAAEAGGVHGGGKLTLSATPPGLSVASVDLDAASVDACASNANNTHVNGGQILGQPWSVDVTLSPSGSTDSAWVCVRLTNAAGFRLRFAPGVSIGVPSFDLDPTSAHVPAYTESLWPAPTQPSATCQLAGGTRLVNITVGTTPIALYTWQESLSRAHLCARAGATGGSGVHILADAGAASTGLATTDNLGACPFPIFTSDNPNVGVYTSNPNASLPVSACVAVETTVVGVTANGPSVGSVVAVQADSA